MKAVEFTVPPAYEGASLKGFLRGFAGCSARLLTAAKRMPDGLLRNGIPATAPHPRFGGRYRPPRDPRFSLQRRTGFPSLNGCLGGCVRPGGGETSRDAGLPLSWPRSGYAGQRCLRPFG